MKHGVHQHHCVTVLLVYWLRLEAIHLWICSIWISFNSTLIKADSIHLSLWLFCLFTCFQSPYNGTTQDALQDPWEKLTRSQLSNAAAAPSHCWRRFDVLSPTVVLFHLEVRRWSLQAVWYPFDHRCQLPNVVIARMLAQVHPKIKSTCSKSSNQKKTEYCWVLEHLEARLMDCQLTTVNSHAKLLKSWRLDCCIKVFLRLGGSIPSTKTKKKNAGGNPLVETHWNPRKVDKGWSHFMHWALLEKKGSLSVKKVADISQVKISWTHSNNWMMDSNSTLNMQ